MIGIGWVGYPADIYNPKKEKERKKGHQVDSIKRLNGYDKRKNLYLVKIYVHLLLRVTSDSGMLLRRAAHRGDMEEALLCTNHGVTRERERESIQNRWI